MVYTQVRVVYGLHTGEGGVWSLYFLPALEWMLAFFHRLQFLHSFLLRIKETSLVSA